MGDRQHQEPARRQHMRNARTSRPPVSILHARFAEFDRLAQAVSGWDLDWQQLDRGRLAASLQQIATPSALLTRVGFSRQFYQRGAAPPGFLTVGFLRSGSSEVNWCGQPGGGDSLMVFHSGGEYESVSPPGFGANTLSFSEELLSRAAGTLGLGEIADVWPGDNRVLDCPGGYLADLRERLRAVFQVATERSALAGRGLRTEIEEEIPVALVTALASGREPEGRLSTSVRRRAARKALALIRRNPDESLSVQQLCDRVGVSERTLRYAFHDLVGVSPKQYSRSLRLNGVRRDLERSDPHVKIADVANRWGFWHMGQFAADYRRQFRELPSETLATHS